MSRGARRRRRRECELTASPAIESGTARSGRPALTRCISVDPDTFAEQYWSRRPLLSPAPSLPRGFEDLFSLDAVDELVSRRGLRTPFLRMARNGQVLPTARFTSPGGAGAEIADQASDEKILAQFADGATLVLQALHRMWPPLIEFAGQLSHDLGHPTQVNAYITPPSAQGFSAHYDVHDVFVLQIAGEKRWMIHTPVLEAPLRTQPWNERAAAVAARAAEPPVLDTVLRPGDALYLPRGWLHSARALGDTACHVTVGVHPVTRYAMVEALLAAAAEDPALRGSLPLGVDLADTGAVGSELDAVLAALATRLPKTGADTVAAALRAKVWPASKPAPIRPLAQAAALAATGPDTPVRVRGRLDAVVVDRPDGQVDLVLADRRLTLPAGTADAVRALLDGAVRTADRLPGLDAADGLVLIRRLLREAVVVPDDQP